VRCAIYRYLLVIALARRDSQTLFTMAHAVDVFLMILALVLPTVCVGLWPKWGIMIGAFTHWLVVMFAGDVANAFNPNRKGALLDGPWLMLGWLQGLLLCCFLRYFLSIAKRSYLFFKRFPDTPPGEL
jgi:hypothetical protein